MGLRERVITVLVIIALTQIACRHCMPRTTRKASLKRYLNDLKPVKNHPVPTPYSPSRVDKTQKQTFGKTVQNGRNTQNTIPKKSLYKTYNFPENEFPLDNCPRDRFGIGMKFNENPQVSTLQKARNLQNSAISDLKKEIKMKRKLLSNKQVNNENSQLKTDTSSIKITSDPDSIRLLNSETFPEVQYPLNTMDTWGQNYWNYLPFTQEKQSNEFGRQTFNSNSIKPYKKSFERLTKAKASKFLQSYDKLKEEHKRVSTENSKRSNADQTGLNFTKTATCERVSDDFIIAGLLSNIPSNSTEMKKSLESTKKIIPSSENTYLVTEYPYNPMPIPYKVIEENSENICPAFELQNITEELQDVDKSVIAKTLQLIEEILLDEDTSSAAQPGNLSKEVIRNVNSFHYTDVPTNEDIPGLIDSSKSCTVSPAAEILVAGDVSASTLQNNITSLPAATQPENITTVADLLNVRLPIPSTAPITPVQVDTLPISSYKAVPSSTSIIIIPMSNNAIDKSQSHMFETTSDIPIIVLSPSIQSSDIPSQSVPLNQILSISLDKTVPNNQLHNVLSHMAPLQNDDPTSNALVRELLKGISNSGSSLPMYSTLPTNSMCYNNENSPSSTREKPITDIPIRKSSSDDALFITYDEKLPQQPIDTGYPDSLPPPSDFEHPLFHFAGSTITSLSHGPYNNVLQNELPIIARDINSNQQISYVSSKELFIPSQDVTPEHLHKNISVDSILEESLSLTPNDVPTEALDKKFSSESRAESLESRKPLREPLPNLPVPKDKSISSPTMPNKLTESLPIPTDSSLLPSPDFETLFVNCLPLMDTPPKPVSDTSTNSAPQAKVITLSSSPIANSYSMTSDMTLKTELYKIRQILDKMLSSENPSNSQVATMDTTLLPVSDSGNLSLFINQTQQPTSSLSDSLPDKSIDSLLLQVPETLLPILRDEAPMDSMPLPLAKLLVTMNETVPLTSVPETAAKNKPYLIDNLVIPLSDPDASRTKDPSDVLTYSADDLPFKMDMVVPDLFESSGDDVPMSVNDFAMEVDETPLSEVPVSNPLIPTDAMSFPVKVVFEAHKVPDVITALATSGSVDQLPEEFKKTDETHSSFFPTDPLPQAKYSSLSPYKLIPVDDGIIKVNAPFTANTEGLPLIEDCLLTSIDNASPDTLVNSEVVSPSLNKELHPNNLDNTSDKLLSDSTVSDIPCDDFSLAIDHMLPFPDDTPTDLLLPINKTPSTSKLHLTKELLENVLHDITKVVPPVAMPLPVQPTILDIISPPSETKELPPLNRTLTKTTSDHLPLPSNNEDILTLSANKMNRTEPPILKILTDMPLQLEETNENTPDIVTENVEAGMTETLSLDNNEVIDKVSLPNDTQTFSLVHNKTPASSKLPIAKILLENVLSNIKTKGFTLPVSVAVPVTSPSVLDKMLYSIDSTSPDSLENKPPLSTNPVLSDQPADSNLPFSENSEDILPVEVDETVSVFTNPDIPLEITTPLVKIQLDSDDDLTPTSAETLKATRSDPLLPNIKTPSSLKIPITKALLESVLSDINTRGLILPRENTLSAAPNSQLDKTFYFLEVPSSEVVTLTY